MDKAQRRIMSMLKSLRPRSQKNKGEGAGQSVLKSVAVPVLVTVLGGWFASGIAGYYNRQQKLIAQKEAEEKFITYLDSSKSNPQQRYLAIQSLIDLQAYDTAADLLVTLPHDYEALKQKIANEVAKEGANKRVHSGAGKPGNEESSRGSTENEGATVETIIKDPLECGESQASKTAEGQEDCNFASLLFRYSDVLLPRLIYRAGNKDDPYSERSSKAIGILLQRTGLDLTSQIAFTPVIREAPRSERAWFHILAAWNRAFAPSEEISMELRQRCRAVFVLKDLVRKDLSPSTKEHDPVKREQELSRLQESRYLSLGPLFLRVATTGDPSWYDEQARVDALEALRAIYPNAGQPHPFLSELRELAADPRTSSRIRRQVIQRFLSSSKNIDAQTVQTMNKIIAMGLCDDSTAGCSFWFTAPSRRAQVQGAIMDRLAKSRDAAEGLIGREFREKSDLPLLTGFYVSASAKRREAILDQIGTILSTDIEIDDATGEVRESPTVDVCGQITDNGRACDVVKRGLNDASLQVREAAYKTAFSLRGSAWQSARSRLQQEGDPQFLTWFLVNEWGDADETGDEFDCSTIPILQDRINNITDVFKKTMPRPYFLSRKNSCEKKAAAKK